MQPISIISHKPGPLSFPILLICILRRKDISPTKSEYLYYLLVDLPLLFTIPVSISKVFIKFSWTIVHGFYQKLMVVVNWHVKVRCTIRDCPEFGAAVYLFCLVRASTCPRNGIQSILSYCSWSCPTWWTPGRLRPTN